MKKLDTKAELNTRLVVNAFAGRVGETSMDLRADIKQCESFNELEAMLDYLGLGKQFEMSLAVARAFLRGHADIVRLRRSIKAA
jgi:hypothetical protein